jgi:hypothetical protein
VRGTGDPGESRRNDREADRPRAVRADRTGGPRPGRGDRFRLFDAIHELDNGLVVDENSEGNAGHLVHAASLSQLRRHIDVAGRTRRNHHVLGRTSVTHEELDGFGRLAGAFFAELERKFR